MRQRTLRYILYSQILQTPYWVRDTVVGLLAGGLAVVTWTALQPPAPVEAAAPAAVSAPVAVTPYEREMQIAPINRPLLWRVQKNGNTVWLFGSVHVLKSSLNWMDTRLFQAFDSADAAWFEVPDFDSLPHFTGFDKSVMAATPVLTKGLTDEETHELESLVNRSNLTLKDVERVRPGTMAGFIAQLDTVSSNFTLEQGADMTLFRRARMLNMKIDGFEDNRQHYSYLYKLGADMGEDGTVALKRALANHFSRGDGDGDIDRVVETWRIGDQKTQTDSLLRARERNPRFYDVLVAGRNALWLPKVETMLTDPAPHSTFVTVGMAHLIGPDGLVEQLRAKGYTVERVDY